MSCSSRNRRIAANLLLRGGELLPSPIVEVDAAGQVVDVKYGEAQIDRSPSTEFYSGIMLPGFINAHSHLELSYLVDQIEPHCGFAAFASQIGAKRNNFTLEERLRAIDVAQAELYREGVAAVADIINGDTGFEVKSRCEIEYRNFAELFGLQESSIRAIEPLLQYANTTATPHSLYSLNDKVLSNIAQSADDNTPLSIHFMESEAEQMLYDRSGSLYEWYERMGFECDFLHYGSPAERLVSVIPPDRSVMLVHNCYVRQRDIDIVMNHFTAPVYWVLCPRSNDYISGVQPPVELLRANNLNICIGTDSLASNWSLSVLEELKMLHSVPLAERLDWATRIGADALRFNELGEIAITKRPRINILSGIDYERMQLTDSTTLRRVI